MHLTILTNNFDCFSVLGNDRMIDLLIKNGADMPIQTDFNSILSNIARSSKNDQLSIQTPFHLDDLDQINKNKSIFETVFGFFHGNWLYSKKRNYSLYDIPELW